MDSMFITFWCVVLAYSLLFSLCTYIIKLSFEDDPDMTIDVEKDRKGDEEQANAFIKDDINRNPNIITIDKEQHPSKVVIFAV